MKITKNQLKRMIREELDSQLLDDDNDGYSYASSSDEQYAQGYKDGFSGREFDDLVGGSDYEDGYAAGVQDREESDIRNSKTHSLQEQRQSWRTNEDGEPNPDGMFCGVCGTEAFTTRSYTCPGCGSKVPAAKTRRD